MRREAVISLKSLLLLKIACYIAGLEPRLLWREPRLLWRGSFLHKKRRWVSWTWITALFSTAFISCAGLL